MIEDRQVEDFCVEIAGVPVRIRCRYNANRAFFRDYLSEKEALFTVEPGPLELKRAQTDLDRMEAAEGMSPHPRTEGFLENNAIHALLAEKLAEHDVLLMHGSALCMDGEGIIFTAKSGTGKSTHARLWREAFGERVWMINDDKPLLRFEEKRVTVWGSPWDGKHRLSRNASAPLKAVVKLERGAENRIAPMEKTLAFPVLMEQCYRSRNPAKMARIMELEKRLLNEVEFYAMRCNTQAEAAIIAWQGMNADGINPFC